MADGSHTESIEKKKRLRVMVIKEIVQTEQDFISKIEMLCNVGNAFLHALGFPFCLGGFFVALFPLLRVSYWFVSRWSAVSGT